MHKIAKPIQPGNRIPDRRHVLICDDLGRFTQGVFNLIDNVVDQVSVA